VLAREEAPPTRLSELQQRLSNHITEPRFGAALWGVKIVSANSSKVIFEQNAEKLFSPASNSKLYTVAMALDGLGADYHIKTSILATSKPDGQGVLNGDLVIYGRGDPGINARLHSNDLYLAFQPLVALITNAGIRRIDGDLIGDETFLQGSPFGSGWAWDDAENYYGAEISALTINDNILQVNVKPGTKAGDPCKLAVVPGTSYIALVNGTETMPAGGRRTISFRHPFCENTVYVSGQIPLDDNGYNEDVTVHNPAGLFVWFLREALAKSGIIVGGKTRIISSVDLKKNQTERGGYVELGFIKSQPLSELAAEIMKPSQNLYTDLLLAHAGELHRSDSPGRAQTSEQLGIRDLNKFLGAAGIKRGDVFFEEGSGLSRNNLTTPNATIALLQYMSRHKTAEAYFKALPVAGVDGTLRNRMKGTPAERNVRAKTGTLRWANSLSGEATTAGGERLFFSIMLNRYHSPDPNRSARADIDAIPILLASFSGHVDDHQ
jgi:D-alanyl-D-alanine carboxypeptidase/D-alanyl-D-alanine-endopeptidase (penicillin-binding protein 4)